LHFAAYSTSRTCFEIRWQFSYLHVGKFQQGQIGTLPQERAGRLEARNNPFMQA